MKVSTEVMFWSKATDIIREFGQVVVCWDKFIKNETESCFHTFDDLKSAKAFAIEADHITVHPHIGKHPEEYDQYVASFMR